MSINSADFEYIRQLVRDRSALVLANDKTYLVESRLKPLTQAVGIKSIQTLVAQLRTQSFSDLHQKVIEAMVTTETSFFRDQYPFTVMRENILPNLIQQQQQHRQLNLFCAACSTGQEPYSIAMLLQESFPQLKTWTINLIANDISGKVLDRARKGEYTQHQIERGLPIDLRQKYFQQEGKIWQLKESTRRMVEFQQFNLAQSWPYLPKMDVIFLRNVLIYFDVKTKQSILAQVSRVLKPEGYLFLGGGETTLNLDYAFEPVQFNKYICYRLRPDALGFRGTVDSTALSL